MLTRLIIKNFVLIESLDVDFTNGLTIITGETGAGKSILLGALGLVLGNRADANTLFNKKTKCIIEAHFEITGYGLKDFFYANELDYEPSTIIRREINPEGKSRAFINDTPVNVSVLKELSQKLVDVHSQHETLTLTNSSFQRSVVDAFAKQQKQITEFEKLFSEFTQIKNKLSLMAEEEKKSRASLDYFQFQFDELNNANLAAGEQQTLEEELQTLNNAGTIKTALEQTANLLSGNEANILNQIASLVQSLNAVSKYNSKIADAVARLQSTKVELKDISDELEQMQDGFQHNPNRVAEIDERLNTIYRLQQKHHTNNIDELISLRNEFETRLQSFLSLEDDIKRLSSEVEKRKKELLAFAEQISQSRKTVSPKLEKEIKQMLSDVGMPHAQFNVDIETAEEFFSASGIDRIKFLFSANKGVSAQELSKVASGGELSRFMLCIKALVAKLTHMPTIIFDEIDSGISGEIGFKVGNIIEKISASHQVIAITHLPQMASKGQSHYLVYKEIKAGKTSTAVKLLDKDDRIKEIAMMISGSKVTDISIANAKQLLNK